eukprot:4499505-Prymnesium_polylepis.2
MHQFIPSAHDIEPLPKSCTSDCARQLSALAPVDAFGTLLWLLRRRLLKPRPLPAFAPRPAAQGSRWLLRDQPWLTSAASCQAALAAEGELERQGKLPESTPTLGTHGMV